MSTPGNDDKVRLSVDVSSPPVEEEEVSPEERRRRALARFESTGFSVSPAPSPLSQFVPTTPVAGSPLAASVGATPMTTTTTTITTTTTTTTRSSPPTTFSVGSPTLYSPSSTSDGSTLYSPQVSHLDKGKDPALRGDNEPTQKSPVGGSSPISRMDGAQEAELAAWEHETLGSIFLMTTDAGTAAASKGTLMYVDGPKFVAGTAFEAAQYPFNAALADSMIVERLSLACHSHVEFLVGAFRREEASRANVDKRKDSEQKFLRLSALDKVRDLIVSYCGICLKFPDMFPQSDQATALGARILAPLLLSGSETGLPPKMLELLVVRFADDGLDLLLLPLLLRLSNDLRESPPLITSPNLRPPLAALGLLCELPPAAALVASLPNFVLSGLSGMDVERQTFLGPFLSPSPMVEEVARTVLTREKNVYQRDFDANATTIRHALHTLVDVVVNSLKKVLRVKGSTSGMERVLTWFASVTEANRERTKMRANWAAASSDGFLLNLCAVMLALCQPILVSKEKMALIDASYLVTTGRLDVTNETKLFAMADEVAPWVDVRNSSMQERFRAMTKAKYEEAGIKEEDVKISVVACDESKTFNFVTEIFFLTGRALNVGLLAAANRMTQLYRALHEDEDALRALEAAAATLPREHYLAEESVLKGRIERGHSLRMAFMVHACDPRFLSSCLNYYLYLCEFLVKLVDPNGKGLPLPTPAPMVWSTLCEYVVENIADFVLFALSVDDSIFGAVDTSPLIVFVCMFVGADLYIRNPYLRKKLVQICAQCAQNGGKNTGLRKLFEWPLAIHHLVPLLLRFYIDIEHTGSHTEFYDKFDARHYVAKVLDFLWPLSSYQSEIVKTANNSEIFIPFADKVLSDSVFCLDESLDKIRRIHTLERMKQDHGTWAALSNDERREREQELMRTRRDVTFWMRLASDSINLINYLSTRVVDPFMAPELVGRLANMLNHVSGQLAGAAAEDLNINDANDLHFNPRKLLIQMTGIYLNLRKAPAFVAAVAADDRSYSKEFMARLMASIQQNVDGVVLKAFKEFAVNVEEAANKSVDLASMLGEIPDDFMCPISYEIMRDPVTLPGGTVVDRPNIVRSLLSSPIDPFSRLPLSIEQVVPNTELKARIDAFIKERLAAGKASSSSSPSSSTGSTA